MYCDRKSSCMMLLLACTLSALASRALADSGCVCPLLHGPICNANTGAVYDNECFAECAGDLGPFTQTGCPVDSIPVRPEDTSRPSNGSSGQGGGSAGFMPIPPGDCICTEIYQPVCSLSTGETYSNDCVGRCTGAGFQGGAMRLCQCNATS
jgi:hypothetical protein